MSTLKSALRLFGLQRNESGVACLHIFFISCNICLIVNIVPGGRKEMDYIDATVVET